jgi:hypothetical protein
MSKILGNLPSEWINTTCYGVSCRCDQPNAPRIGRLVRRREQLNAGGTLDVLRQVRGLCPERRVVAEKVTAGPTLPDRRQCRVGDKPPGVVSSSPRGAKLVGDSSVANGSIILSSCQACDSPTVACRPPGSGEKDFWSNPGGRQ